MTKLWCFLRVCRCTTYVPGAWRPEENAGRMPSLWVCVQANVCMENSAWQLGDARETLLKSVSSS